MVAGWNNGAVPPYINPRAAGNPKTLLALQKPGSVVWKDGFPHYWPKPPCAEYLATNNKVPNLMTSKLL